MGSERVRSGSGGEDGGRRRVSEGDEVGTDRRGVCATRSN